VDRLRADAAVPAAAAVPFSHLAEHLVVLLADVAGAVLVLAETGPRPSALLTDAADIRRLVSARHGAQRARLGWSEVELRREFTILRKELAAAIARRALRDIPGPTPQARSAAAERAVELLDQFVSVAERLSLASFRESSTKVEAEEA